MNIGLIGLGYWGKNLYRNLLISKKVKEITLKGMYDEKK